MNRKDGAVAVAARSSRETEPLAQTILSPAAVSLDLRTWVGLVLLSFSWVVGLDLYQQANAFLWWAAIGLGALLITGSATWRPGRLESVVVIGLCLPMLVVAPWPYKSAPLLIVAGLAIALIEWPVRSPARLAVGLLVAGLVLLAQSVAIEAYVHLTARSHELPGPIASPLGWVARMIGIDAAVASHTPAGGGGVEIALRSMRRLHHLGATWELFLDPLTLALLAGGAAMIGIRYWHSPGSRPPAALRAIGVFFACVVLWLPLRAALLMALLLTRTLHTDFDAPLAVMDMFYSPWVLALVLVPPVLLAWRFVRVPAAVDEVVIQPVAIPRWNWRSLVPAALAFLGVAALGWGIWYDPAGGRKGGRVMVDEFRSQWEPVRWPFDTAWYGHHSGYNYWCIFDYTSRFYDVSRFVGHEGGDRGVEPWGTKAKDPQRELEARTRYDNKQAFFDPADRKGITADTLKDVDVLIIKCPTARYTPDEIKAIVKFVNEGGGLLLIGEHTDVFGIGTYANDIARHFGFQFRYDVLYGIDQARTFDFKYHRPLVPHPIVQRMPPMDFEGPCTIAPGWSRGHPVMLATGQRAGPAEYHHSNFMPGTEDRPDARYGAFTVMWATRFGKGRVIAHADSTQFSNFSAFEPGKPESWVGMIEWLNRRNGADLGPLLPILGIVLLAGAVVGTRWLGGNWLIMIAAGMCAFGVTVPLVRSAHSAQMPAPVPRADPAGDMILVGVDRGTSDAVLSKGGFIGGKAEGFGIFERWILRLGWFTQRGSGPELLDGKDVVVFFTPGKEVPQSLRQQVKDYVHGGGHVLVVDMPENAKSTANALLRPFGMELRKPYQPILGEAVSSIGLPTIPIASSLEVTGGTEVLASAGDKVVAARSTLGKGSVTAIGFGAKFNDASMGVTGDIVPDESLRKVYDAQYGILRHIVGQVQPASRPTTRPDDSRRPNQG